MNMPAAPADAVVAAARSLWRHLNPPSLRRSGIFPNRRWRGWARTRCRAEKAPPAVDPAFDRDTFLLRQKHFAINEKYAVWDNNGEALLFVERPTHLLRNLLAFFAAAAASIIVFTLTGFTYEFFPNRFGGCMSSSG